MTRMNDVDWRMVKAKSSLGLEGEVRVYETTVNGFDLTIEPDRYRTAKKTLKTEFRWRARLQSGAFKPWSEMCPSLGYVKSEAERWAMQQKVT